MNTGNRKAQVESGLLQIWYGGHKPSLIVGLSLSLLELIYKSLRWVSRQNKKSVAAKKACRPPVLVIGNLIAGGAGKTPIVMAVCQHFLANGQQVGIVSRGYGRSAQTPMLIDPGQTLPAASEVGDEPLFLSHETGCPVAVCADRSQAVNLLLRHFPDLSLIVSDDGLQHHRLARQLEWVVFDSRAHGNGRLLPAGPLREPLARLDSVDAVLCSNIAPQVLSKALNRPVQNNWHAIQVQLTGFSQLSSGLFLTIDQAKEHWKGLKLVAFTGMGNPEKLFAALRSAGLNLDASHGLPDHFNYPEDFCAQFIQQVLITSGKDAVKLDHSNPKVWVAEISVTLPPALTQALEDCIGPTID
ncbi:tetraacyldisaccharide 4'-kinase [uncultured Limnobacter sp.]|uniref:tetraacyldisaccharide 4'-kinase n=1 Tax=uncultured Limnobacter sp. TaxID=199681 RepID=UPI0030F69227